MPHLSIDWVGYLAAALTTGSFVPQAWLTFRTRDVSGISLAMYCAFTAGVFCGWSTAGTWASCRSSSPMPDLHAALGILAMKLGGVRSRPALDSTPQ